MTGLAVPSAKGLVVPASDERCSATLATDAAREAFPFPDPDELERLEAETLMLGP